MTKARVQLVNRVRTQSVTRAKAWTVMKVTFQSMRRFSVDLE